MHSGCLYYSLTTQSKSQLRQDLFCLYFNGWKKNGFFFEAGALDGVRDSNTYLLETLFGWRGMLVEPSRQFHQKLRKNRRCRIDTRCLFSASNKHLEFNELPDCGLSHLKEVDSTAGATHSNDSPQVVYSVPTVSLNDLLENCPDTIDYLSLDTEGSEYLILKNFDFSKHRFNFISVEHNNSKWQEPLTKLLTDNGYKKVYENLSGGDGWYVPTTLR